VEEAGNGLLPPGIILHGLNILLLLNLLDILDTSTLSLSLEEIGNSLLPSGLIFHSLQILLPIDLLATYLIRAT
jgi:hypothetical protein